MMSFRFIAIITAAMLLIGLNGCAKDTQDPALSDSQPVQTTQTDVFPTTEATDVPTEPEATDPKETVPAEPEPTEPEPTEPEEPQILFEYQLLHAVNNDMVGWMEIPGTKVSYPVVQSCYEPNFYLRRNFWQTGATCGTLYAREKCDIFLPADNITIYGHNMSNGTMFADLHKYKDPAFWESHRYMRFDTIYERHEYEIFAVFVSSADMSIGYPYHIFDVADDQAEYDAHIEKLLSLSLYDTGIKPQYGEKIITLSTCDKSIDQGRLVVVARCVD